jgi:hypothetical protein
MMTGGFEQDDFIEEWGPTLDSATQQWVHASSIETLICVITADGIVQDALRNLIYGAYAAGLINGAAATGDENLYRSLAKLKAMQKQKLSEKIQ